MVVTPYGSLTYNLRILLLSVLRAMVKIEFSTKAVFVLGEKHFRKCFSVFTGVWLRTENAFSGNAFQLAFKRV